MEFNKTPKVSVIVPVYNHDQFLTLRIESILNQSYQDFELIILDDCSTDKSLSIINSYSPSKISHIITNRQNGGSPFKQWKKGIEKAKGEYIWIAESDDYCSSNFLKIATDTFNADPLISLFYSKSEMVDEDGKFANNLDWWYSDLNANKWNESHSNDSKMEILTYLSKKNTIVNASAVVFKNTSTIVWILNEVVNYKFCGDWMFWLIYLKSTDKLFYSTNTTNYFRTHNNTTRQNVNYNRNFEILKIYKWVIKNVYDNQNKALLFKYFFDNHIIKPPRRFFFTNTWLLIKSTVVTKYYFSNIILYYLKRKN
ncbi:glycosyltransferase family 2 protein [Pedobacter sp. Leaf194]|uniref:glycosyltransferase family 2 protein n=1 Tax=Pedobacter sp. Leaf194 TaxID=1736297 RepID=UPI0007029AB3|nr:glycosyltransferase [Pedobacter sp. Leaf194]KQS36123.1 hypothetical protein ASG14_11865 [Pedobacter sp. Leaf194]